MSVLEDILAGYIETFHAQKELAERAIEQVSDQDLRRALDEHTNSIAVIMKHVAGNLRSRFTDFLTSDGEKAWRDRDGEFVDNYRDRAEIVADWESGWGVLFAALDGMGPERMQNIVHIRGEAHSVPRALDRALAHVGYHAGQIVLTARVLCKDRWATITIPRGGSAEWNRAVGFEPSGDGA